jgi:anti-sigma-K factor RskA
MMGCEDINTLMIEYIDGALNDEDARRVDEHLSSCEDCRAEMANMKSLLMKLDDFEMEEPSENLKRNFQSMVDSYSLGMNNRKIPWHEAVGNWIESWWPKRPLIQFVTTVAVLIIGLVTGLNISYKTGSKNDIAQLKTGMNQLNKVVMTSLLNQSSAADRISGLSKTGQLKNVDNQFYSTLLLLLNSDPNVNVRLAAVNALTNFVDNEYVRRELVISLGLQSSPLVQVSLIDLLASIKEADSSSTLIRMINNPEVNEQVKERARKALKQFI